MPGILNKPILLLSWHPTLGKRRWIRVHFSGEVEALTQGEFYGHARDTTFAIFVGLVLNEESPMPCYLSIVAPSM
jgi:hypothetical protein